MRALVGMVAMVLLLTSCGGADDGEKRRAAAGCRAKADNAARAEVIAKAYEAGKLGTQAEVEADFARRTARIFDDEGHMVPYRDLKGVDLGRFEDWAGNSAFLNRRIREDLQDAQIRISAQGYPGCPRVEDEPGY